MSVKYKGKVLYTVSYHARPKEGTAYLHPTPSGSIIVVSPQEKRELMHADVKMKEPEEAWVPASSVPVYTRGASTKTVYKAPHDDCEDLTSYTEMRIFQRHLDSFFPSVMSWTKAKHQIKD